MNKYQEALDLISEITTMNRLTIGERSLTKPSVAILQELVDKATPMKPLEIEDWTFYKKAICGRCNRITWSRDIFCDQCGQRLDWSVE